MVVRIWCLICSCYLSSLSVVQLFPQLKETMVDPLRTALEHYEKVKATEDTDVRVKKEVCP